VYYVDPSDFGAALARSTSDDLASVLSAYFDRVHITHTSRGLTQKWPGKLLEKLVNLGSLAAAELEKRERDLTPDGVDPAAFLAQAKECPYCNSQLSISWYRAQIKKAGWGSWTCPACLVEHPPKAWYVKAAEKLQSQPVRVEEDPPAVEGELKKPALIHRFNFDGGAVCGATGSTPAATVDSMVTCKACLAKLAEEAEAVVDAEVGRHVFHMWGLEGALCGAARGNVTNDSSQVDCPECLELYKVAQEAGGSEAEEEQNGDQASSALETQPGGSDRWMT
jgi:hypothetical protein